MQLLVKFKKTLYMALKPMYVLKSDENSFEPS